MDNSEITTNDILDELTAYYTIPELDPTVEFSVKMFCKRTGRKQPSASKILSELVEQGKLSVRVVKLPSGCVGNAYRGK